MEFLWLAFAAFRITRLVTKDTFPPVKAVRDRLLLRWPDEELAPRLAFAARKKASALLAQVEQDKSARRAEGDVGNGEWQKWRRREGEINDRLAAELRAARPTTIGELITCPWCAGFWIAVAVFAAWTWGGVWAQYGVMGFAVAGAGSLLASIENVVGNVGVTEGAEVERLQEMKDNQ